MEALGFALMETQLGEPVVLGRGKNMRGSEHEHDFTAGVSEVCKPL